MISREWDDGSETRTAAAAAAKEMADPVDHRGERGQEAMI